MNYILKGDPKEVAKVLQENRIRVDRGVIAFTPCQPDSALDADSIATLREDLDAKTKSCMEMAASQIELADLTGLVVSIAVEGGQTIPGDIAGHLAKFGIIVPKISETAQNTAEISENLTESVPNPPDNANMDSKPDAMDNKHIEVEDMQEVNLDADDKTPVGDDTKYVSEDDAKETAPAKKTSKRSKKSE